MIGGSVKRLHLLLIDSDVVAYYKKSPKLFELSPIEDFASVVEIASQFSSYISYNYTPHCGVPDDSVDKHVYHEL